MSFLQFQDPIQLIIFTFSCILRLLLDMTVSETFPCFNATNSLKSTSQISWKLFLCWDLSDVSLLVCRSKFSEDHRGKVLFPSSRFIRLHTVSRIYDCWCWSPGWGRIVTLRLLFSPFQYCTLWTEVSTCNPDLRGKELCSLSFSVENLYKLFRIPLHGRFVSSPTFIIVFNHLFISAWTHGYFILWVIIQHYFTHFIAQIVLALVISSFQLALMSLCFDVPYLLWSFFELLFSGKARCSRLILYITSPSPTINPLSKESAWFCWRMILHSRFGRKVLTHLFFCLLLLFRCSVMSNSLGPHGL